MATGVYQDSIGFIWIGTEEGLNRFDGKDFVHYTFSINDTTSISNNHITAICEDRANNLWIGTKSGLNRLNREYNILERHYFKKGDESVQNQDEIKDLMLDSKGDFWICTGYGLKKLNYNKANGSFSFSTYFPEAVFRDSTKKTEWTILAIAEDVNQNLWLGSWGGGLMKFDPEKGLFTSFKHAPNNPRGISSNKVKSIYPLPNGKLLIGTYDAGLNIFDPANKTFVNYSNDPILDKKLNSNKNILSFLIDRDRNIWIGTSLTLNIFDNNLDKKLYSRYAFQKPKGNTLSKNMISCIYEDRTGIVWVTSGSGGVDKYDPNQDKFSKFRNFLNNQGQRDHIKGFAEDKYGKLWLATYGNGVINCEKNGKMIYRYTSPNHESNIINALCYTYNGHIWCASNNGIFIIDPENRTMKKLRDGSDYNTKPIMDIEQAVDSNLWVVKQGGGISIIDPIFKSAVRLEMTDTLNIRTVQRIKRDHIGNMVAIGKGGAAIVNIGTNTIKYLRHYPDNASLGLCNNQVLSFTVGPMKRYWFGTEGGITVYTPGRESFQHFHDTDGLASQYISCLASSGKYIWAKSSKSVISINTETNEIKNHYRSEGLDFSGGTLWNDTNGKIHVAGEGNFTAFYPNEIKDNPLIHKVVFTGLWVNGIKVESRAGSILEQDISFASKITLNQTQRVLRVTFSALNYMKAPKIKYKYKLEGYDTAWINLGHSNELSLMNLNPGNYTLKVLGSNNDQVWNTKPAHLNIMVLPPWWRTWQSVIVSIIIMASIIFLYRLSIIRRERVSSEMKKSQEIKEMHLRLFTNISHEFRTPLTLIMGPLKNMLQRNKLDGKDQSQLTIINKNANRMLRLVNQMLDLRKYETGNFKLRPQQTEIVSMIKELILTFEYEAAHKDISLRFSANPSHVNILADVDILEKIITNLVANAIKFTPKGGEIEIQASLYKHENHKQVDTKTRNHEHGEDHVFSLRVADSGTGIPDVEKADIFNRFYQSVKKAGFNMLGTGIGLNIVKELTELHHGTVQIENNTPTGTVFTISIPVTSCSDGKNVAVEETFSFTKKTGSQTDFQQETTIPRADNLNFKTRVLVVEDNPELRHYITGLLSQHGYNTPEANHGKEALEMIEDSVPDLVISDIMMPEMDGTDLCISIKNNDQTCHVPVILLTAKALVEDKLKGFECGADGYITKPFDDQLLLTIINNLLKNRAKIKSFFSAVSYQNIDKAPDVSIADKKFLANVEAILSDNYQDGSFEVNGFAKLLNMSVSSLYQKFTHFIGLTPADYIRIYRLNKAAELLRTSISPSISEIAYKTGFKHASNFSRSFQKQFGMSPSQFMESN
jgi:signal transduction histidine kinase/DNA-binding response OmpR family regulator/ligand-binding sensor domain-containing protein